jgi:hypothetical protein
MTSQQSAVLPEEEKLRVLKESKGSQWYDGWRPYCLVPHCRSYERMDQHTYGFKCHACGNMIGFDLVRLDDSPLNETRRA